MARTEGQDYQSPRVQDICWFKYSVKRRECTNRLEEIGGLDLLVYHSEQGVYSEQNQIIANATTLG